MSLEYAILGFLSYHSYTGYDLKKIFDSSIRHFWSADQSQIYRTLSRLTEKGWTQMEKVPQEDHPDRKVYSITENGQTEFHRWLQGISEMGEPHSAPLIQVFFGGQLTNEEILAKFETFAAIMRHALAQYDQVPGQIVPFEEEIPSPREHYFWMLTLDNGIRNMRANLEWAENVIQQIKSGRVPER
jgi:DNA-binding PadR family transcriptional regulator